MIVLFLLFNYINYRICIHIISHYFYNVLDIIFLCLGLSSAGNKVIFLFQFETGSSLFSISEQDSNPKYIRWYLSKGAKRKEQPLLLDLFKTFDQIESCYKSDIFCAKRHAYAACFELHSNISTMKIPLGRGGGKRKYV